MNSPNPIQLAVPLAFLRQSPKYNFQHNCSSTELSELKKLIKVEKITRFSFKGVISHSKKKNYTLHASLKAALIQNCILTLKPIKTIIDFKLEEFYVEAEQDNRVKNLLIDTNLDEGVRIQKVLNIGNAMLEALSLEIPSYPKKKNASFEGVTITETGIGPLDRSLGNPFFELKNFLK